MWGWGWGVVEVHQGKNSLKANQELTALGRKQEGGGGEAVSEKSLCIYQKL